MRATPVITFVAVASLPLAIGANTAIFSILNSLVLETLPVREPERRSFSLLRPIADATAQDRIRELVLEAYAEYEEATPAQAAS